MWKKVWAMDLSTRLSTGRGWHQVSGITDDQSLINLAASLGCAREGHIARLLPMESANAKSRSFSFTYGLDEFPLHTDVAFWPIPARYLVMWAEKPSTTPTLILGAAALRELLEPIRLNESIFSIRTTRGATYSGLRFQSVEDNLTGIRFDPFHTRPANNAAQRLAELLRNPPAAAIEYFAWSGENAVVIDNWTCLHGRAAVEESDRGRVVRRLYIGGSGV